MVAIWKPHVAVAMALSVVLVVPTSAWLEQSVVVPITAWAGLVGVAVTASRTSPRTGLMAALLSLWPFLVAYSGLGELQVDRLARIEEGPGAGLVLTLWTAASLGIWGVGLLLRRCTGSDSTRPTTVPTPAAAPVDLSASGLTAREKEVFLLLSRGLTNSEIATHLGVGAETVKSHVAEVLRKLELRDRVQAVIYAYERGVLVPGAPIDVGP